MVSCEVFLGVVGALVTSVILFLISVQGEEGVVCRCSESFRTDRAFAQS